MATRLTILFLVAAAFFPGSQDSHPSAAQESTEHNCQLTQDDYAVFGALLSGLHGPEHPEEAWEGKEMLIVDVTATPGKLESQPRANWGFRSKSSAAPSQETFSDYAGKVLSACAVRPEFGDPKSYKMIASGEKDDFFKEGVGRGWQEFYRKYPRSGGYWQFSRPGYNSTQDEALLYVVHSCGGLCGTGHLYLLSKQNGQWSVKNRLMLWIS
jgi:hypothetical protein